MTPNDNSSEKKNNKSNNVDDLSSDDFEASPDEIEIVGDETPPQGDEALSEVDVLKKQLVKAKSENLYLRADFDNFRKKVIKERSDLLKFGAERIIRDLLEVVDNFTRALEVEVNEDNFESFKEGVQMISTELQNALAKHGVKEIETEGPFDPTKHEALSSEETDEVPPGHISRVLKKAFSLHDRVIRPAQVVVAKEKSDSNNSSGE